MAEDELRTLLSKRGQITSQLTRFCQFVNNFDGTKFTELQLRLDKIENFLWNEFENVQTEIELSDETESNARDIFESTYFEIMAKAKNIQYERSVVGSDAANSVDPPNKPFEVKLPTINLPEFDGKYENWLQYHDTFAALIDSNSALPDIQKFYYLKSSLKGEALQVIESLHISDTNYHVAWTLLKERFENKRLIIHTHVKSLFDMPSLFKESHTALRKLLDNLIKHIRALEVLGEPVKNWNTILIYLISTKLDGYTKLEWEKLASRKESPSLDEFLEYLKQRCQLLESLDKPVGNINKSHAHAPTKFSHIATTQNNVTNKCTYCNESHYLYACNKFIKLPVKERYEQAKKLKVCTNCLRSGHFNADCKSNGCKKCGKRHNSLLHFDATEKREEPSNTKSENTQTVEPVVTMHSLNNIAKQEILLSTATIAIFDKGNNPVICRAILDSGSQSNFITDCLFRKLGLRSQNINVPIAGINSKITSISKITKTKIKSLHNAYSRELSFFVLDKITENVPHTSFEMPEQISSKNVTLADNKFNEAREVDILLGAEIFWNLMCVGQITTDTGLVLQKTTLGWIVAGPLTNNSLNVNNRKKSCNLSMQIVHDNLQNFWKLEECPADNSYTREELECEKHFVETVERNENGRFIVSLPARENLNDLGESLENATKRFYALERKLANNTQLKQMYTEFMTEYETLEHMTKLDDNEINNDSIKYYLPHHGVFKESSLTTRLRVVFDASAKTSSGLSLNDTLLVGPTVQDELFSIILRFRKHRYVITADIAKMYRQVDVTSKHRDLQRIIWRSDPTEPIKHYRLNTVTYGTAPASFLATRCLKHLAIENQSNYPQASNVIKKDFYVDDLITGSETIENAIQLRRDITKILDTAGFPLRKWISNNRNILKDCEKDKLDSLAQYIITDGTCVKTLGLLWNAETDNLQFTVKLENNNKRVTKRIILSTISRIFDPLGLIGPVTVKAKIILQRLWLLKSDWDESVPTDIYTAFQQFQNQLTLLNKIEIPRFTLLPNSIEVQIHGFCDASEKAYGACLYVRSSDKYRNCTARLLCAKSRVAPLKSVSLPRLELCGAVLLAQLMHKTINSMDISFSKSFYWCDSTVVLAWIASTSTNWKTFVCNRVAEIQRLTDISNWRHVISKNNPADIISRGIYPENLINNQFWWSGPHFLLNDVDSWPKSDVLLDTDLPEQRKQQVSILTTSLNSDIFTKFSSLTKLQRVIAYCLRFYKNATTHKTCKLMESLSLNEIDDAMLTLIKLAQADSFESDLKLLIKSNNVPKNSKLLSLNPFLDKHNIIRVGGRITRANLSYDFKHPILIPAKHKLTELIINYEHLRNLHAGTQATLAAVRQRFWPINGKSTVKRILHGCVTCFKSRPKVSCPLMGDLPYHRLEAIKPFFNVGVDLAGPLYIKDGKLKNRKIIKCYLCLFICFATKAVHIELTTDLSANSFLNVLKRFVSRRGVCKNIFSDNATNFVGSNNELKKVYNELCNKARHEPIINHYLTQNRIEWHFIPARSPHFGGLWEAAVKSAKYHIKRILGDTHLTFEDLSTVVVQVEAVLNSRPITPLSHDPNDLSALTPSHFLIGQSITTIPQSDVQEMPSNRLSHFQRLQQIAQHFWARWRKEYLTTLQERSKWKTNTAQNVKPGSMVLLHEDNTPSLHWPMGRIEEVITGKDGIARVVIVKTVNGSVRRSITKISVLPIDF